jgi:regulator of sirC expression with transglutaminase-like and TPR domain
MTVSDQSLRALASLLESEGPSTISVMVDQMRAFTDAELLRLGSVAPPDSPTQSHIDLLLAERWAPRTQARFLEWTARGRDLEDGILLINNVGYPRVDSAAIRRELDELAAGIERQVPAGTTRERLGAMCALLTTEYGFHGNTGDYYDPDNSFLHRVLERRTGLPLSLTVLFMLLGKRLALPITAIPLPSHVIAALPAAVDTIYFDPFDRGRILTLRDIVGLVNRTGKAFQTDLLHPATARQIIERTLANLIHGYREREEPERAELMQRFRSVV